MKYRWASFLGAFIVGMALSLLGHTFLTPTFWITILIYAVLEQPVINIFNIEEKKDEARSRDTNLPR